MLIGIFSQAELVGAKTVYFEGLLSILLRPRVSARPVFSRARRVVENPVGSMLSMSEISGGGRRRWLTA